MSSLVTFISCFAVTCFLLLLNAGVNASCDGLLVKKEGECFSKTSNTQNPSWPCACQLGNSAAHLSVKVKDEGGSEKNVNCDELIKLKAMGEAPTIGATGIDKDASYSVVMADPDAPCQASDILCYYMHWVVTDVTGSSLLAGNNLKGFKTLLEYAPPTPPSGTHRYQFFLFSKKIGSTGDFSAGRANFDLNKFIKANDLCGSVVTAFQLKCEKGN